MHAVYIIGTCDTKGYELAYMAGLVRAAGQAALLVDVGTGSAPVVTPDVDRTTVAACHPDGAAAVLRHKDRGAAVTAMSQALGRFLSLHLAEGKLAGVAGVGGTGGTALLSAAFRQLPIGLPKVLVSTVASGNTEPYIGTSDFVLIHSVVDIAGLNRVSRKVLGNAAHAIAGMAARPVPPAAEKPTAGLTMFGVTTPCVSAVRETLEAAGWDALVFHATGTGGRAMEMLAASGLIGALADLTTTEVADEVVGGVFRAGPDRFHLLARHEIPCVLSLGALDMVNFGAADTVPESFRNRRLHVHNAQITLMRTTPEENREFARWMMPRILAAQGPLTLLIPEGGVSLLDAPGQPFHDPDADAALFDTIESLWQDGPNRQLLRLPHHINDPAFSAAAAQAFLAITRSSSAS
jgi:uncharacterized protein (UPF0261 family)